MELNETRVSLSDMEEKAGQASRLLKALSNECRLLILCNLLGGEKSVTQINDRVALSQSALSQHLARLRKEGLVAVRKEAQTVYYRMNSPEVEQVIGVLYQLYCR